jgi:hypothetical protein
MIWLHLGRVLGMVGLVSGLIPLVIAIAQSELSMALTCSLGMAAALGMASYCDRAVVRRRIQHVQDATRRGKEFVGERLVVGLRWIRWTSLCVLLLGAGGCVFGLSRVAWQEGSLVVAVGLAVVGLPMCLALIYSLSLTAIASARNSGLLHVDKQGIRVAGVSFLPWHGIRGVDVVREISGRGPRRYRLRVAIDPEIGRNISMRRVWSLCRWSQPSLIRDGTVLDFPMLLLAGNPHFIGESCRALGVHFGLRFLPQWRDMSLWTVAELERQAEESRRLDEMLSITGTLKPADLKRMTTPEQRRALVGRMDAMDRLRSHAEEPRG